MGLLQRVTRRAARAVVRAAGLGNGRNSLWSIVNGAQPSDFQGTGKEVRLHGWEVNAVVNACARAIVDIVASVEFEVVKQRSDGKLTVIPNHDAALILNGQGTGELSGYEYRADTALHYLLYGNSPQELQRGARNRVQGVELIHPEQLQFVYLNSRGKIARWQWQDLLGEIQDAPVENILHFKDLSATPGGLFGFPRAAAALGDIATDVSASTYVRQTLGNSGTPGMVVETTEYQDTEELKAAEDRFNERMVQRGERGRSIFVNGEDMKFTPIGFNLRELEFPDLRRVSRESICTAFNVDPRIVGVGSATNDGGLSGVQYREARFRLIQQACMPVFKARDSQLNRWFMPEFGEVLIRFSADGLSELTEDETATSARVLAEVEKGVRTIEEARETIGLTAKMDRSHHFAVQKTLMITEVGVVEQDATLDAGEMAAAIRPPPAAPAALPTEPKPKLLPAARASLVHRAALATEAERGRFWSDFDEKAKEEETPLLRILHGLFASDWTRLAALLTGAAVLDDLLALQSRIALLYAANGPIQAAWADQLRPVLESTIRAGARDIIRQAPTAGNLPEAQILAAARRESVRAAAEIASTSFEQIQGLLAVAEGHGQRANGAMDLIHETLFGAAVDRRATTIARTEVPQALNAGSHLAAMESRALQTKHWVSQRDGKVRSTHRHAEGQGWIWIERAFGNGLQFPGDPQGSAQEKINCRCAVAYSAEPLAAHLGRESAA